VLPGVVAWGGDGVGGNFWGSGEPIYNQGTEKGGGRVKFERTFFSVPIFVRTRARWFFLRFFSVLCVYVYIYIYIIYSVLLMPGHVAMATVSPAKMRGKNLRFLPTSFPFYATDTAAYIPPAF